MHFDHCKKKKIIPAEKIRKIRREYKTNVKTKSAAKLDINNHKIFT